MTIKCSSFGLIMTLLTQMKRLFRLLFNTKRHFVRKEEEEEASKVIRHFEEEKQVVKILVRNSFFSFLQIETNCSPYGPTTTKFVIPFFRKSFYFLSLSIFFHKGPIKLFCDSVQKQSVNFSFLFSFLTPQADTRNDDDDPTSWREK